MRIIDDLTVYDSFEEISQNCPIGSEQREIVKCPKYTWDEEEDSGYVEYYKITTCSSYIYNGEDWRPLYSTRREPII